VYAGSGRKELELLAIFQQLGLGEILIILAVLLLLFGARKLPELARSMGRSTKEFKAGLRDGAGDPSEVASEDAKTPEQTKTPE
jgi:sec-independent protein translocase protein TatA